MQLVRKAPARLKNESVSELLALHGLILEELRAREIVRSSNNPGGDYAEYLFAKAFGWRLTNNSHAGHDAIGKDGRYQIKCRRMTKHNSSRQLSAVRSFEKKQFDYLAGVIFNDDYSIHRAAIIPRSMIREPFARFSKHVNGWLFRLSDEVWRSRDVKDVTVLLQKTAGRI